MLFFELFLSFFPFFLLILYPADNAQPSVDWFSIRTKNMHSNLMHDVGSDILSSNGFSFEIKLVLKFIDSAGVSVSTALELT